ncbi:MAG TPA: hypothetical protein VGD77_04095 [Gemmatimonadaceae bacterium]
MRRFPALLALLLASSLGACRAGVAPLMDGGSPAGAGALRNGADEFLASLAGRYGVIERAPRYARARQRIGQMALIPSRVFDDTALWSVRPTPAVRILIAEGAVDGTHYRLRQVATAPPVDRPGDGRHAVVLTRLGDGEYRWDTSVDYSMGGIGARHASAVLGAFLASADARDGGGSALRADYRAAFPRTTAALGALFSVDSLHALPLRDGSSAVTLGVRMHTEGIRARFPQLAGYLDRYVVQGKWRATYRDASGAPWITGNAGNGRMLLSFRTAGGRLAPQAGAVRAMPDTLLLDLDFSMKVGPFTIGFDRLHGTMARHNTAGEATWEFIAQQEPEWRLPPLAERLIHSPLRRPFQGDGARFRIGFRDEGDQTLLARHVTLTVQESAVMRFIGRLGATAFGDISDAVEQQEAQFLRGVFTAMRADLAALPSS